MRADVKSLLALLDETPPTDRELLENVRTVVRELVIALEGMAPKPQAPSGSRRTRT